MLPDGFLQIGVFCNRIVGHLNEGNVGRAGKECLLHLKHILDIFGVFPAQ